MKTRANISPITRSSDRQRLLSVIVMAAGVTALPGIAGAQTFNPTSGTPSYNVATNFTPNGVPNSVGATVNFQSPTAALTINLSTAVTLGTINFTNNGTFVSTLANGTGGSLTLDATGTNEAAIVVSGSTVTTNAVTISASVTLNDTLRFTNNTLGTGAATATITGSLAGAGGFIKDGAGRFSFSTAAKAYTGPTTVAAGRLRYTGSGQSTGTSAVTVNSGGSLYLDQSAGAFSFGGGTAIVTINGNGDADTIGALRDSNSGVTTLANPVALGSDATVQVDTSTATFQLNGGFSGTNALTKTGTGALSLNTSNVNFTGATLVSAGTITAPVAGALSKTSGITVNTGATLLLSGAGNLDRVNDAAGISLAGGTLQKASGSSEGSTSSIGLGALTLTAAGSKVDFSGGAGTLTFTSFSPGSFVLALSNYPGTGAPGGAVQLIFNEDEITKLGSFDFGFGPGVNVAELDLSNGFFEVYSTVAVPKPTTVLGGILLLGAAGWTQRRRLQVALGA